MSELEFRPRFRFHTPLDVEEVKQRIAFRIGENNPDRLVLGGTGSHLVLTFPSVAQHAWTPQMDVDVSTDEGRTLVRCLIGPAPSIWMLFMGGYLVITVAALLGITLGMAQQMVSDTPWGYFLVAPMPAVGLVLWLLAQGGKRRSRDEMRTLKNFMDQALGCDCFALSEQGGG
jgi:hypothetical protein